MIETSVQLSYLIRSLNFRLWPFMPSMSCYSYFEPDIYISRTFFRIFSIVVSSSDDVSLSDSIITYLRYILIINCSLLVKSNLSSVYKACYCCTSLTTSKESSSLLIPWISALLWPLLSWIQCPIEQDWASKRQMDGSSYNILSLLVLLLPWSLTR